MDHHRLRNRDLAAKVMAAADAAELIEDKMVVAASGFTPAGYPKEVPIALARRIKRAGQPFRISLLTGASTGDELDGELARAGLIEKRAPYQTNTDLRSAINRGQAHFLDPHLGELETQMRNGFFGDIDVAIVEACAIRDDGGIVPTTSVGSAATAVALAKKIIVEINRSQPLELEGIHDIYSLGNPPGRLPIPLTHPGERIGLQYIPADPKRIAAVVFTDRPDSPRSLGDSNEQSDRISALLLEFLEHEVSRGRMPASLLPLQSGVGDVANSVLAGLMNSRFENLTFFSEVIQDSIVDLIDAGRVSLASGTAFTMGPARLADVLQNLDRYKNHMILRPQEITNNGELIARLGVIAMNTAVEFDVFGNVNSSHILGSRLINGIGGSGDFARNAHLSVFCAPSTRSNNAISCVVPMVTHTDHIDNDVDLLVTEQGLADLRGLSPIERAKTIIRNCAHPLYRELLQDYLNEGVKRGGHIPVALDRAFCFHSRFAQTKSMLKSE